MHFCFHLLRILSNFSKHFPSTHKLFRFVQFLQFCVFSLTVLLLVYILINGVPECKQVWFQFFKKKNTLISCLTLLNEDIVFLSVKYSFISIRSIYLKILFQEWKHISIIPAQSKKRQKDPKLKTTMDYVQRTITKQCSSLITWYWIASQVNSPYRGLI